MASADLPSPQSARPASGDFCIKLHSPDDPMMAHPHGTGDMTIGPWPACLHIWTEAEWSAIPEGQRPANAGLASNGCRFCLEWSAPAQ